MGEEPGHPLEMINWKTESQHRRIRTGDTHLGVIYFEVTAKDMRRARLGKQNKKERKPSKGV